MVLGKITELSSDGDGTFVRETEVPHKELYEQLDAEYSVGS